MAEIVLCPAPEIVAVGSTIGEVVDHWGRAAPNSPAIAARNRKDMSYGELAHLTDSVVAQLQHAGYSRYSRLAVVHRGGAEALTTILGVVKQSIAVPISSE
jgi:acyl-CoA synthetase (AMP-forming)/AMP-acid ligase II